MFNLINKVMTQIPQFVNANMADPQSACLRNALLVRFSTNLIDPGNIET